METAEGYNKETHIAFLHGLVDDIKKEWPDEIVCVDEETVEIVWERKPKEQNSITDTKHEESSLDKYRRDYPWI